MSADDSKQVLDYPFRAPTSLEPPKEFTQLRQGCPVAHVRLPSGDKAVLLTRYDDVKQVMSDPRFSHQLGAKDAARISANEGGGVFNRERESSMSSKEGHQRWRRLVSASFTAKRMLALQPRIVQMAEQLIDAMQRQGNRAELVSSLGFPLPVMVICELLGVPQSDSDKFAYWSNTLLNLTQYSQQEIDAAQADFARYFLAHIAAKRKAPGEDLLSELISVVDAADGRLSEMELLGTGQGLLVAGHETTANMIGKMVAMLLSDRRRWEQLLADPSLVRTAVEEALRFDANPGFGIPRYLSEDVQVAGETLPRGTTVICNMAAANRDEKAFAHAEEMDLRRSPNAHLAFGAGPYSCIGQSLARTELQTVLNVLLRRLPTLELDIPAEALPRREGLIIGGLDKVPVRW
jgi:cytochrome P450